MNLFQQAEQGFDKLFGYNRHQTESFDYHNTMKNNSIFEQFRLQEQGCQSSEQKTEVNQDNKIYKKQDYHISTSQLNNQGNDLSSELLISLISSEALFLSTPNVPDEQLAKPKRKKRKKHI